MKKLVLAFCLLAPLPGAADESLTSPSPEGAEVYFIGLEDGAVVDSPFTVRFGLRRMGVTPAGHEAPNTGHHHLLIDLEDSPDMALPLPKSATVVHFGGGQTETVIDLPAGDHTLQLLLGNYLHVPHDPPVISERIRVTVR
jgi:hypothetical protein